MIGKLSGRIDSAGADGVVIDVGGVGYLVSVSARTLASLPAPGGACSLLVETMVREDAITLYGFLDVAERAAFRTLLTVQGVGAKVALGLLGTLSPGQLAAAIAGGDRAVLSRAPGVGPRLAARLVTELKDKAGFADPIAFAPVTAAAHAPPADPLLADVLSALANLGYRRGEAEPAAAAARAAQGEAATVETVLTDALRALAKA
ncbi:Holliday junction branch migration protein RuvA [Elioraea rosea]|uniref:Holliday junction branch migration protein RuvA n=1 Tax=Elioraea rosea TaxID=2492390 RepID=UPI001181CDB9|nr:Holliday junction branch migration protein RuvA [Elioraea rosea]